ncbi:MAG: hypothetical protein KJ556_20465 [Gammaproteobacteria bacterium]|nr:hypothetical protein [Gammaproteobacteria bacterium]
MKKPAPYLRDIGEEFETKVTVKEGDSSHALITWWRVTGYAATIANYNGAWGERVEIVHQTIVPLSWAETVASLL